MNRGLPQSWTWFKKGLAASCGGLLAGVLGLVGVEGPSALAQPAAPSEYQFKAAFIYHFAQFVEWPAAAFSEDKAPFVVGILGENPFGHALEQAVNGKSLNEHPLVVREFRSAAQAKGAHILFISVSEKKRLPEIFAALKGASVLTISETDHVLESGPIINFITEGNKIRFQISEEPARQAGLKISSKLLSLASRRTQ